MRFFEIVDIILIIGAIDILILLNYVILQIIIGGDKCMTEKARNIEKPQKEKDGTIRKDERGYRWIFRNGLWYGMCRIEEVKK